MGVPLVAEVGRDGGYFVMHNSVLPVVRFTDNEVKALFIAFMATRNQQLPYLKSRQSLAEKLEFWFFMHRLNCRRQLWVFNPGEVPGLYKSLHFIKAMNICFLKPRGFHTTVSPPKATIPCRGNISVKITSTLLPALTAIVCHQ